MMRAGLTLMELAVSVCILTVWYRVLWRGYRQAGRAAAVLSGFCAVFLAFSAAAAVSPASRPVTITALDEKSEFSENTQIYLQDLIVDGKSGGIPGPAFGRWRWYHDMYCWFAEDDERHTDEMTDSISFTFGAEERVEAVFFGNRWKGKVRIESGGEAAVFDTCREGDENVPVRISLQDVGIGQRLKNLAAHFLGFALVLLFLCAAISVVTGIAEKMLRGLKFGKKKHPYVQKLLGYQFLFEELVSRDFKKKYKRTVLGMVWSVLSPLLQLLVMWLVFSKFFGRNTAHYVVYIFAGNIVYTYFNESTSSGMTSLMDNSAIYSKVNVPKYLFLFSKNVTSFINFALTLMIFFVFVALDQITFTWKFVLLLYPIFFLVLFNIGVGLILSALFVFFRDIQYLWSIFTQLLMYISAIFYNIDQYSMLAKNLFLLNPIYLFIRYFRKIVIEATIPTVWFHLLMAGDAVAVLALGCWMYKKYNTKFLYYV